MKREIIYDHIPNNEELERMVENPAFYPIDYHKYEEEVE